MDSEQTPSSITNKATSKMIEEKKQREHLLQLNQILAQQVMEMSKIVAGIYLNLTLHAGFGCLLACECLFCN